MFTFFQSIASHSYTFREVAAYVTISSCMSGAIMFLIAAYTRIFAERKHSDYIDWSKLPTYAESVAVSKGDKVPWYYPCIATLDSGIWVNLGSDGELALECPPESIIGPLPPWRKSLRRRPE